MDFDHSISDDNDGAYEKHSQDGWNGCWQGDQVIPFQKNIDSGQSINSSEEGYSEWIQVKEDEKQEGDIK